MPKLTHVLLLLATLMMKSSIVSGGQAVANNVYEDGVTLTITSKPFNPKSHVIKKCGETVCVIDGKPAYGAYGRVPKQEVTSLVFEKQGRKVALDVSGMYNPNVNNSNIKQYVKLTTWDKESYWVTGYFSHDDGDDDMYICLWLVMLDGSIRNYMGDYGALSTLTERVEKDFKVK